MQPAGRSLSRRSAETAALKHTQLVHLYHLCISLSHIIAGVPSIQVEATLILFLRLVSLQVCPHHLQQRACSPLSHLLPCRAVRDYGPRH